MPTLVSAAKKSLTGRTPLALSFPLWHVLPVPLSTGLHNGTCPAHLWSLCADKVPSLVRSLVWPATQTKCFCKGLRDGTWQVPRGTDRSVIGTIVFPLFCRVERFHPGSYQSSHSCSRCQDAWACMHKYSPWLCFTDPSLKTRAAHLKKIENESPSKFFPWFRPIEAYLWNFSKIGYWKESRKIVEKKEFRVISMELSLTERTS